MHLVYLQLSGPQAAKLAKGQAFQVTAARLADFESDDDSDSHEIQVTPVAYAKISAAVRRGKGYRFSPSDIVEHSGGSLKSIWKAVKKHAGSFANAAKVLINKDALKAGAAGASASLAAATGNPLVGMMANGYASSAIDQIYDTDFTKKKSSKKLKKNLKGMAHSIKRTGEAYVDEKVGEKINDFHDAQREFLMRGGSISSFFKSTGRKISRGAKKAFKEVESAGKTAIKGINDNKKLISNIAAQTALSVLPAPLQPLANYGAEKLIDSQIGSGLSHKLAGARARVANQVHSGQAARIGDRVLAKMPDTGNLVAFNPRTGGAISMDPVPRRGRFEKGSPEACEYMARIRGRKISGGSFRSP